MMLHVKRHWFLTGATTALAAALLGTGTPGCASERTGPDKESGAVGLDVTSEGEPGSLTYKLTGPGGFVREGKLGGAGSAVLDNVPRGNGYQLELHGKDRDGGHHAGTSGKFDVRGHGKTPIRVHLPCKQPQVPKGNKCPTIEAVTVVPSEAEVGSTIALTASAVDPDKKPKGGVLTYRWTASGTGTFSDPSAGKTEFTCTEVGATTITVTVSDGDTECLISSAVSISCANRSGEIDPCAQPQQDNEKRICALLSASRAGSYPRSFTYVQAQGVADELRAVMDLEAKVSQGELTRVEAIERLAEHDKICLQITGWSCVDVLFRPIE
jgi:hypothetical protein